MTNCEGDKKIHCIWGQSTDRDGVTWEYKEASQSVLCI